MLGIEYRASQHTPFCVLSSVFCYSIHLLDVYYIILYIQCQVKYQMSHKYTRIKAKTGNVRRLLTNAGVKI
jgi:hypothetical protein